MVEALFGTAAVAGFLVILVVIVYMSRSSDPDRHVARLPVEPPVPAPVQVEAKPTQTPEEREEAYRRYREERKEMLRRYDELVRE